MVDRNSFLEKGKEENGFRVIRAQELTPQDRTTLLSPRILKRAWDHTIHNGTVVEDQIAHMEFPTFSIVIFPNGTMQIDSERYSRVTNLALVFLKLHNGIEVMWDKRVTEAELEANLMKI